jgi:small GTP-binding protein
MVEDQQINLQLWDTAGQEDYKKLRPLSYPQTDVFVLCFSLVAPTSFENINSFRVPEVQDHCPMTPYSLVGMKSYLRDDFHRSPEEYRAQGMEAISSDQGEALRKDIGAHAYIECSSKLQKNLKEVFEAAIRVVLHPPAAASSKRTSDPSGGTCCTVA